MSHEFEWLIPSPRIPRILAKIVSNKDDVLPVDDARQMVVQVAEHVPILLVEGRPGSPLVERELFYFATAVCPDDTESAISFVRGKIIHSAELPDQSLSDYAAVILGNVPRLAAAQWSRLDTFVREGGGLAIFLGDQVQGDNYNMQSIKADATQGLLPLKLVDRVNIPADQAPLRLKIADSTHPVIADVARHENGGLLLANVSATWRTVPLSGSAGRAILNLPDKSPALSIDSVGRGRVAVWSFGANMVDSNLPSKPDYPPLMWDLAVFLATEDTGISNRLVGESLVVTVPPGLTQVDVRTPTQERIRIEPERAPGRPPEFIYRQTVHPGFYSMNAGNWNRTFAVNVDTNDSDLSRADRSDLERFFGRHVELLSNPRTARLRAGFAPSRELAPLLALVLLACIGMESVLASWFGGRR